MSTLPISHVHASYSYTPLITKKQLKHTSCSNIVKASSSVNSVIVQPNGNQVSTSSVLKRRELVFGIGVCYSGVFDLVSRQNVLAADVAASPCELTVAPSGLAYCDKVVATGPEAAKGQLIKAHYVGKLENGTVFDSSYNRGKPLTFRIGVGEVIRGWDMGIMGGDGVPPMLAGGKRRILIPPELGYGVRGAGCRGGSCIIPPNSVLLFDVEFIGKVIKGWDMGIMGGDGVPPMLDGFRWDRQWLVVNARGRAYTQRVEPKLALVQTELPAEAFSEGFQHTKTSCLVLKAPGMNELKVPLTKPSEISEGVSVWEWSGAALDEGAEASKWFSTYIGKPSRLVRFNEAAEIRAVDPDYARGYKIMFSDQYPFLLISESSMNAFNKLLKEPVLINRFRPNIVVDGCEPFAEDLWKEIKINKFTFHGVKLCSRCKVPTINQETAIANPKITETLKAFRSDTELRPTKKQQGLVYFGQNLVCMESLTEGRGKIIKVGDPITVLKVVPSSDDAPA